MPLGGIEKKSTKKKKKISRGKGVRSNERPQRKLTPRQFIKRHEEHEDLFYYGKGIGYDKTGWTCGQCDTDASFEHPDVDREFIGCKVQCLLEDWNSSPNIDTNKEGLYISNNTEAEVIVQRVVQACDAAKKYSEAFIKEAAKNQIGRRIEASESDEELDL